MDDQKQILRKVIDGLNSENAETRKKCVLFLARVDNPKIISFLKPLLDDENDEVRRYAEKVIVFHIKKYNQIEPLIAFDQKENIKSAVTNSNKGVLGALEEYLKSDDFKKRVAAVESVYNETDPGILQLIKTHLIEEKNEFVIATCLILVGKYSKIEDIPVIKSYLYHSDPRVRSNAVEALKYYEYSSDILIDIFPLASDTDDRVRITASQYISRADHAILIKKMVEAVNCGDLNLKKAVINLSYNLNQDLAIEFYQNVYDKLEVELKSLISEHLKKFKNAADKFIICDIENETKMVFESEEEYKKLDKADSVSNIGNSPKISVIKVKLIFFIKKLFQIKIKYLLIILLLVFIVFYYYYRSNSTLNGNLPVSENEDLTKYESVSVENNKNDIESDDKIKNSAPTNVNVNLNGERRPKVR